MRAAEALRFDVIVAEDVDRISRDQSDWHTARKRLDFLGIAIHTASGKVGKLDGALRALMGEMFLARVRGSLDLRGGHQLEDLGDAVTGTAL
jgi:site-specific DNA recombinase